MKKFILLVILVNCYLTQLSAEIGNPFDSYIEPRFQDLANDEVILRVSVHYKIYFL